MKRIVFAIFAAACLLVGCSKDGGDGTPLTTDFNISSNPCNAGDPIEFTASVKGGVAPYKYAWAVGTDSEKTESTFTHVFKTNGTVRVTLVVTDSKGASAQKMKLVVVNPAQVAETGEVSLEWVGYIEGYNSMSSPAVANDGSVYAVTDADKLYKFSAEGTKSWEKKVINDPSNLSNIFATPSIDDEGTVYIPGGSERKAAVVVAFNPDGSEKWKFTNFWNKGESHEASITGGIAGIGDQNIYVGNTGFTGTVIAIDKTTGERKGYVVDGSSGPTGGARAGVVISKSGYVHWYAGQYGVWGAQQSGLDSGTNGYSYAWRLYGSGDFMSPQSSHSSIGCMVINGKDCVVGQVTDKISTKVYAVDCSTGAEVCSVRINDTAAQDQGGISTTEEGYIVASLNYELGKANGGIIVVDPVTSSIKARFSTQEKVSGSSAVDNAGNIHFFTESGYYYIVKPDYTSGQCELKVKRDITEIIKADSRYSEQYGEMYQAKFWCSAVIGDTGKIYCCFTDEDTRTYGGVLCVSYEGCEGPANSDWPMIGQNRRHTNKQK